MANEENKAKTTAARSLARAWTRCKAAGGQRLSVARVLRAAISRLEAWGRKAAKLN